MGSVPVDAQKHGMSRLAEDFRRTDYVFEYDGRCTVLHIDAASGDLAALHLRHDVSESAYITACNPGCRIVTDAENEAAMASLRREIRALGLVCFEGQAMDSDGKWPPEPSLLVLGLSAHRALAMASRYGQYALLLAGADARPRLEWTGLTP